MEEKNQVFRGSIWEKDALLTEENGYVRHLLDNYVQHFVGNILDLVGLLLLLQPLEHLLLVLEITLVHHRDTFLEVEHRGYLIDTVLLGFVHIVDFHERYAELVTLVVDVLQFVENLLRLSVVVIVCGGSGISSNIIYFDLIVGANAGPSRVRLTEQHGQGLPVLDETVQHLIGNVLDLVFLELRQQPF